MSLPDNLAPSPQTPGGVPFRFYSDGTNLHAANVMEYAVTIVDGSNVLQAVTSGTPFPTVQTQVLTRYNSSNLENNNLVVSGAHKFYRAYCNNTSNQSGWFQVFDATAVPADGAVSPVDAIPVNAFGYASLDWGALAETFVSGIAVAFSTGSTPVNKTTPVTSVAWFHVEYV
ncbi:MAG: hypothetical protein KGJ90_00405 [Patescibacteria group bacterium]|nr:hypothetical protein [Patescibacteria group bacterium]